MGIRLDQINLVVGDMEAMADFYGHLGVRLRGGDMSEWAPHHRNSVDRDGVSIDLDSAAFASVWNQGWPGGTGVVLGFKVPERDDVDRLYDELTGAGHAGQQPPHDAFFGARYAVVADPDGNSVGIMSPIDPARRTEGPPPPTT
ncbi:MAG TPA: VOC family protein [Acidimicrobiales bacterium]|nr:VOC family protein [Acidimicrobiales bacterium]